MVEVNLWSGLTRFTDGVSAVEVEGTTIGEVLDALIAAHPDLKKQLFNDEGKLRSFVNVYVSDEDIRYLDREKTPVKRDDTISIVPSIAGGR